MKLKMLLLLLLVVGLNCCQAMDTTNDAKVMAPKINWQPVLDEEKDIFDAMGMRQVLAQDSTAAQEHSKPVQVHKAPIKIPLQADVIVIGDLAAMRDESDNCAAPNGLGLENLLLQAKELLPQAKLNKIFQSALRHDKQVQSWYQLHKSSKFLATIEALKATRDFSILSDYICKKFYLNVNELDSYIKNILQLTATEPPATLEGEFKGRTGVRGLLQDLADALPKQKFRDLYERLMSKDEILVQTVNGMRSPEYRQLVQNLQHNSKFQAYNEMLMNVGMRLPELKDLIDITLGWQGDEFDNPISNNYDI